MKPTILIATSTAIAGFVLGWLVKPSADPSAKGGQASVAENQAGTPSGKSHDRKEALVLKPRGSRSAVSDVDTPGDPEVVGAQVHFERSFKSAMQRGEAARLERLTEALGLSPEQKEAMEALLGGRRDGFRELTSPGKTAADMVADAANAERLFQRELEKILDPEQLEAFKAKMEREKENSVQASAYRDLADLSSQIDLSPEQREKALRSLLGTSQAAHDKRPEGWTVLSETFGMLGGAHGDVLDDMGDMLNQPEVLKDPQAMYNYQMDVRKKDLERKVAQFSSILTPAQLAQYRATLNSRVMMAEKVSPSTFKKR
jgi:hypothetical protein